MNYAFQTLVPLPGFLFPRKCRRRFDHRLAVARGRANGGIHAPTLRRSFAHPPAASSKTAVAGAMSGLRRKSRDGCGHHRFPGVARNSLRRAWAPG